jgi:hypothetical protein
MGTQQSPETSSTTLFTQRHSVAFVFRVEKSHGDTGIPRNVEYYVIYAMTQRNIRYEINLRSGLLEEETNRLTLPLIEPPILSDNIKSNSTELCVMNWTGPVSAMLPTC